MRLKKPTKSAMISSAAQANGRTESWGTCGARCGSSCRVEETENRVHDHGARVQSMVVDVLVHAGMLRQIEQLG